MEAQETWDTSPLCQHSLFGTGRLCLQSRFEQSAQFVSATALDDVKYHLIPTDDAHERTVARPPETDKQAFSFSVSSSSILPELGSHRQDSRCLSFSTRTPQTTRLPFLIAVSPVSQLSLVGLTDGLDVQRMNPPRLSSTDCCGNRDSMKRPGRVSRKDGMEQYCSTSMKVDDGLCRTVSGRNRR